MSPLGRVAPPGGRVAARNERRIETTPEVSIHPSQARGTRPAELRAVLGAAWLAVGRPPLLVPAAVALALALTTWPWADEYGTRVVHGVAVLLACGLASATDDPAGEVVAAAPVPRHLRTLSRVATALTVLVPIAVVTLVLVGQRSFFFPTASMVLELVGYAALGGALGTALRAWGGLLRPAYPAVVGMVLLALVTYVLPRGWVMVEPQPWGRPYDAALLRWAGLIVLCLGVVGLALRDPASRRG
jgi:hypothetical protein